jgi:hypothetical protein
MFELSNELNHIIQIISTCIQVIHNIFTIVYNSIKTKQKYLTFIYTRIIVI